MALGKACTRVQAGPLFGCLRELGVNGLLCSVEPRAK